LHPGNFDVIRFKPQKWTTIQILGVTRCTCTYTSKYIFCAWVVCARQMECKKTDQCTARCEV
jgi:hypothetical protein